MSNNLILFTDKNKDTEIDWENIRVIFIAISISIFIYFFVDYLWPLDTIENIPFFHKAEFKRIYEAEIKTYRDKLSPKEKEEFDNYLKAYNDRLKSKEKKSNALNCRGGSGLPFEKIVIEIVKNSLQKLKSRRAAKLTSLLGCIFSSMFTLDSIIDKVIEKIIDEQIKERKEIKLRNLPYWAFRYFKNSLREMLMIVEVAFTEKKLSLITRADRIKIYRKFLLNIISFTYLIPGLCFYVFTYLSLVYSDPRIVYSSIFVTQLFLSRNKDITRRISPIVEEILQTKYNALLPDPLSINRGGVQPIFIGHIGQIKPKKKIKIIASNLYSFSHSIAGSLYLLWCFVLISLFLSKSTDIMPVYEPKSFIEIPISKDYSIGAEIDNSIIQVSENDPSIVEIVTVDKKLRFKRNLTEAQKQQNLERLQDLMNLTDKEINKLPIKDPRRIKLKDRTKTIHDLTKLDDNDEEFLSNIQEIKCKLPIKNNFNKTN